MRFSLLAGIVALCGASAVALCDDRRSVSAGERKTVEDVIPLTTGNLRGHKMLFDEGWYIVTSSSRALDYAKKHSILSSREAIGEARSKVAKRSAAFIKEVKTDITGAVNTGTELVTGGTELTGAILAATHRVAKAEALYAQDRFQKATETFVKGNLSLARRTEEDRQELAAAPGDFFRNLKSDFSNIGQLADRANEKFGGRIEVSWDRSFKKAGEEFRSEYERSGEKPNTLAALGPILYGYLKALYHGVVAPASKSLVKAGATTGTYAVFLPTAATAVVAGRTVQSVGLTFYYTGKTGIKLIAPTVESGLLAGLSVLSLGAVPVTYAAGGAVGAVNQVAFTAAGPALGALEGTAMTAADTASYVGLVTYDGVTGTTKVVINQASTGVVLGYNALTALPTHLVMGIEDAAVFIAWDGPRLVIAAAKGEIGSPDDAGDARPSLGDLPVGTAVDLKKLEQSQGIKANILSTDPVVIRNVLERLPEDLRTGEEKNAQP